MTAAALTRFDLHRMKAAELPEVKGQLPKILSKAMRRLPKLFHSRRPGWKVEGIYPTSAIAILKYHHNGLETRKARDQRYHTDIEVLKFLASRLNVHPGHKDFTWLQLRWTSIEDICAATQFARSTVCASLGRLKAAKILRTQRRKNETKDREWVAVRWFTDVFFEMLGLGRWLRRQKEGNWKKKRTRRPTAEAQALPAGMTGPQALRQALRPGRARGAPPPDPEAGGSEN